MTAYELMIKTNRFLIMGGVLTEGQKANIVRQLLAARSGERAKTSFYSGVRFPNNFDGERRMYPDFYIPPYNGGKKPQTVIPMSPKTHILAANSYELEIIRLLHLFAPQDPVVRDMVKKTLARLKTTCFGYKNCVHGECFQSGLIVLRFLAASAPEENNWMQNLVRSFNASIDEKLKSKGCHGNVLWYFWLCLSELPIGIAEPEILRYRERILRQLSRSSVMNSESDKANHPAMICALRNALARLPEYAHIKKREPYVSEKDGRLYFPIDT